MDSVLSYIFGEYLTYITSKILNILFLKREIDEKFAEKEKKTIIKAARDSSVVANHQVT